MTPSAAALRTLLAEAEAEARVAVLRAALAAAEATPPAPSPLDIGPDAQRHPTPATGLQPHPLGLAHWQHL